MKRKALFGILAAATVALLCVSGFVAAHGVFGFADDISDEQRAVQIQQQEATQEAISNEDFATWKSLQEERIAEMQAQLTEENFNKLVERHSQMQEAKETGDFSKVAEFRDEYGAGFGKGHLGTRFR